MGTYTTNYNLFMPTVGEQGWGELVNGNFETIDTTMKKLSNNIGTLNTETNAMKEKLDAIGIQSDGTVKVNGSIYSRKVFVDGITSTVPSAVTEAVYATCGAQSINGTGYGLTTSTLTVNGYTKETVSYPVRVGTGIYVASNSDVIDSVPSSFTRTATFSIKSNHSGGSGWASGTIYVNGKAAWVVSNSISNGATATKTYDVKPCDTIYGVNTDTRYSITITISVAKSNPYYVDGC